MWGCFSFSAKRHGKSLGSVASALAVALLPTTFLRLRLRAWYLFRPVNTRWNGLRSIQKAPLLAGLFSYHCVFYANSRKMRRERRRGRIAVRSDFFRKNFTHKRYPLRVALLDKTKKKAKKAQSPALLRCKALCFCFIPWQRLRSRRKTAYLRGAAMLIGLFYFFDCVLASAADRALCGSGLCVKLLAANTAKPCCHNKRLLCF